MINNKNIAMQLIDMMNNVNANLIDSVMLVKDNCTEDDFIGYRKSIGRIVGAINIDIIDAIVKEYPELEPDIGSVVEQLKVNSNRQQIIDGLITARQHSDEVNAILSQHDNPKNKLIEVFSFTDNQAQAILDLRAPLEQIAEQMLFEERDRLKVERNYFEKIIAKSKGSQ